MPEGRRGPARVGGARRGSAGPRIGAARPARSAVQPRTGALRPLVEQLGQPAPDRSRLAKLGVVCDEYAVNIYGESSSALHRGTPTDRLVVQWNIGEPHVERRISSDRALRARASEAANAPVVNAGARVDLAIDERRVWVEIPVGFTEMQQQTPDQALEWRMQTRAIFQSYFGRGYRAVDFELLKGHGKGRYLLARA